MTRRLKGMDGDDDNSDGGDENATPSPSSRGAATSSNTSTSRTNRPSNPLQDGNVSLLSSFIYSWTYPLLRLGLERPLQETDLFELADVDSSTYNKEYIQRLISNQRQKSSKSSSPSSLLARALLVDYYQTTRFAQLLLAINTAARITQSVALGLLLEQFDRDDDNNTGDDNTNKPGYLWVGLLILCGLLAFPSKQRLFFETYRKGMQIRIGLVASIYEKTLKLSSMSGGGGANNDNSSSDDDAANVAVEDETTTGHVSNLLSNDVERFILTSVISLSLLIGPFDITATIAVGLYSIGPAFVIGYSLFFIILLPLQISLGRQFVYYRSQVAKKTDARVSLVSQAVSGVRVMKLSGWELTFHDRISKLRDDEVNTLQQSTRYKALNEAIYFFASIVVAVIIFTIHVHVFRDSLTPQNVFTTISLLNLSQFTITKHIPNAIMGLSECYVSCRRIQHFLELDETAETTTMTNTTATTTTTTTTGEDEDKQETMNKTLTTSDDGNSGGNDGNNNDHNGDDSKEPLLALDNVTCYFSSRVMKEKDTDEKSNKILSPSSTSSTSSVTNRNDDNDDSTKGEAEAAETIVGGRSILAIGNVSLEFYPGQLYCIIGKVGCGKSALMSALVGELPVSRGTIHRGYKTTTTTTSKNPSLAYAAQDPWIMDGSVRENVVMGLTFRREWYDTILHACGLIADVDQFIHGDLTIVGDRGVQCSGGQKARISLARALYSDSDILLLDDPLSAVDSKVARLIYYHAIQGLGVKRGKCVILVTHQHQFVSNADKNCILLHQGKVICNGSFADCVTSSNGDILKALQIEEEEGEGDGIQDNIAAADNENTNNDKKEKVPGTTFGRKVMEGSKDDNAKSNEKTKANEKDGTVMEGIADTAQIETRKTGIVHSSTWSAYSKAVGGWAVCIVLLILFTVTQSSFLITIVQIGNWANATAIEQDDMYWMVLIWTLTTSIILLALIRAGISFHWLISASKKIHNAMVLSVLRAKIDFFDTNPLGRILNRFSADVGICDELLPLTIYDFSVGFFVALGGISTSVAVLPFIILILPPLIWYFMQLRKTFVATTRELKRLEGISRSPIFAMASESLNGIVTIRANDKVPYFRSKFEEIHDRHTRSYFAFVSVSRWFATKMDILSFTLMASSSLTAVVVHDQGWFDIDPVVLGVALTMLLQIATTNFPWIVRQSAEVTNQMVSVERILGFSNLPQEAPLYIDDHDDDKNKNDKNKNKNDENELEEYKKKNFPIDTSIKVTNLKARYRSNLPLALKGISFEIQPGERVGIVGRTGSGKSTLVQCLFRLLEVEQDEEDETDAITNTTTTTIHGSDDKKDKNSSNSNNVGKIEIGQVDISTLGLHTLRTSMSVISQVPVLFRGYTIRENLDPIGQYTDDEIWHALDLVQMSTVIDPSRHRIKKQKDCEEENDDDDDNDSSNLTDDGKTSDDNSVIPSRSSSSSSSSSLSRAPDTTTTTTTTKANNNSYFSGGLNVQVAEGGTNWSVGQRQLLCLARAILSKHNILILDEPTANVDMKTDQLLQQTLREQFFAGTDSTSTSSPNGNTNISNTNNNNNNNHGKKNNVGTTILAIAHRLDTIIDYDRIIVLRDGKIAENGTAYELLQNNENGVFASMVNSTGEAMSQLLKQRAYEAAQARIRMKTIDIYSVEELHEEGEDDDDDARSSSTVSLSSVRNV